MKNIYILILVVLLFCCSCININNGVASQERILGKWYSTHVNMNGQWSSGYVYDNGTGNSDKIPMFVRIEYPSPTNTLPFFLSTWCYEFQPNGQWTLDDGCRKNNMGHYFYSNGALSWNGISDDVAVTNDLLIFKRDYGYWILKREGEISHIPLTYERGIGLWKAEMAKFDYNEHISNQIIMPLKVVDGKQMIFSW